MREPAAERVAQAHAAVGVGAVDITTPELRQANVMDYVQAELDPAMLSRLAALAPEHVSLPQGRRLRVHYERDKPPWVESRLQDFFGMQQGPRCGEQAIVLHLLAPNQRPVQVTTDLAGFWQRHYPDIRREQHALNSDGVRAEINPALSQLVAALGLTRVDTVSADADGNLVP